jgi:L-threonylcarbamoyladenylate synthase
MDDLDDAVSAIDRGELVVYPTETVYGLAADALDPAAIERVFETKGRDRSNPISLGLATVDEIAEYADPTDRELAFAREFLPGPFTLVCDRRSVVPDILVGGRDRVGIRIPDHDLARSLLERTGPVTATSANVSGTGSVTRFDDLDPAITDAAAVTLDGGETPGTESTVVDVSTGTIHRRGAAAEAIEDWLSE